MKTNGAPPSSEEGKRSAAAAPDPEVTAKATRRRFTAAYKLSVIEKADACETPGEIGHDEDQIVAGFTDGLENASRRWSRSEAFNVITAARRTGGPSVFIARRRLGPHAVAR